MTDDDDCGGGGGDDDDCDGDYDYDDDDDVMAFMDILDSSNLRIFKRSLYSSRHLNN